MPARDSAPATAAAASVGAAATVAATLSVRVLYFAVLRDLSGAAEESISLPASAAAGVDVSTLLAALERRHTALGGRLGSVRVAVNEEFVELTSALSEGDVVALIPPVSGG